MPTNGYFNWPGSPNTAFGQDYYVGLGVDTTGDRVFGWYNDGDTTNVGPPNQRLGPFSIVTFSYSPAPPGGFSSTPWNFSFPSVYIEPSRQVNYPAPFTFMGWDNNSLLWGSAPAVSPNTDPPLLQAYSPDSGDLVSSIVMTGYGGDVVENIIGFVRNGVTYIAVWVIRENPALFAADGAILQFYDVTGGSPSDAGAVTFSLDVVGFTDAMDLGAFYSPLQDSIYVGKFAVDGSGVPTAITISQIDMVSRGIVGSATFSGGYSFVGNPNDGHIYVLNINGSVTELDPVLTFLNNYAGLAADISGHVLAYTEMSGDQWMQASVANYIRNASYGTSVDILTEQFFMAGGTHPLKMTRVQKFVAMDTLELGIDWGSGFGAFQNPNVHAPQPNLMWIPWRQAAFCGGTDSTTAGYYEFDYTPLPVNSCAGVEFEFR